MYYRKLNSKVPQWGYVSGMKQFLLSVDWTSSSYQLIELFLASIELNCSFRQLNRPFLASIGSNPSLRQLDQTLPGISWFTFLSSENSFFNAHYIIINSFWVNLWSFCTVKTNIGFCKIILFLKQDKLTINNNVNVAYI